MPVSVWKVIEDLKKKAAEEPHYRFLFPGRTRVTRYSDREVYRLTYALIPNPKVDDAADYWEDGRALHSQAERFGNQTNFIYEFQRNQTRYTGGLALLIAECWDSSGNEHDDRADQILGVVEIQ